MGKVKISKCGSPTREKAVGVLAPLGTPPPSPPFQAKESWHLLDLPPTYSCPSFAGRAWLYLALNENSLESYLRLFQENLGLLHKYYVK